MKRTILIIGLMAWFLSALAPKLWAAPPDGFQDPFTLVPPTASGFDTQLLPWDNVSQSFHTPGLWDTVNSGWQISPDGSDLSIGHQVDGEWDYFVYGNYTPANHAYDTGFPLIGTDTNNWGAAGGNFLPPPPPATPEPASLAVLCPALLMLFRRSRQLSTR